MAQGPSLQRQILSHPVILDVYQYLATPRSHLKH